MTGSSYLTYDLECHKCGFKVSNIDWAISHLYCPCCDSRANGGLS